MHVFKYGLHTIFQAVIFLKSRVKVGNFESGKGD